MIRLCATLLALSIAGSAAGQTMPTPAPPADPRIQTLPYDAGRVFPLRVAPRHQLALIFGPEERVENVAIGDSEAWQITPSNRGDSLFIKPLRASGVTNMTVITDAHVYSFELTPAAGPGLDAPYTIRFIYPGATVLDLSAPAAVPGIGRYRLSGARGARPQALDDDGLRTYIEWRQNAPVPAVFAIDERDAETLLQGQMRDGRFVIDAVYRNLVFRLDGQTARATRQTPRGDRR
nr:TrbG/VirB9 family P-type conjugative transfer protein [uncultured Brevundimonas sp.]